MRISWVALAVWLLGAPASAAAQDVAEAGPDELVTDPRTMCGEADDRHSSGDCLVAQIGKARRLLSNIERSYEQQLRDLMSNVPLESGRPEDLVAVLRRSDASFEQYREAASDLTSAATMGGTDAAWQSGSVDFMLILERARFLLKECASKRELAGTVDLTVIDWCPRGL